MPGIAVHGAALSAAGSIVLATCGSATLASDVLTYHNDNARTGLNANETVLTPANVNAATFGKLFVIPVDGKVDAQPLYRAGLAIPGRGTRNVLFVATEHDSVYALDADSGEVLWQVSLLGPGETTSDARNCNQVVPEIGVTATPVIDLASGPHGTLYVVAMSKDSSRYYQRLHALDLTTGAEQFNGPRAIQATYPGTGANSSGGAVVFDPRQYKSRSGLLLLGTTVYTSWSSHCDIPPYTGWFIGYNGTSLEQTDVLNLTPNGEDGSVWASGAAPATDSSGNVYLMTGNGTFERKLDSQGFPYKHDFGNAFVRISAPQGHSTVTDYFTMYNTAAESLIDQDLGSGGVLVLPDLTDALGNIRHLAVGAGKDQKIYVVDRDNMGKFNPRSNRNLYQELPDSLAGAEFGMAAYFNSTVYYGAVGDALKAFAISDARLDPTPRSQSANTFGYPGTTPSISANGTSNGIVWSAENGSTAVLHAYDATNLATELYNSNQAPGGRDQFGTGNKFITPTVANGKVYVGTTSGVGVFGLLAAPARTSGR